MTTKLVPGGRARAQASTEYLIILAVVLTLALTVLGAFGLFPSFAYNAQAGDSSRYWAEVASPIQIADFKQSGSSLSLILVNSAPVGLSIDSFRLSTKPTASYAPASTLPTLPPGGRARVDLSTESCSGRQVLSYEINFTYHTSQITGLVERGAKPLYVQCVD